MGQNLGIQQKSDRPNCTSLHWIGQWPIGDGQNQATSQKGMQINSITSKSGRINGKIIKIIIQNPDGAKKEVWFCDELLVEREDAVNFKLGENVTFMNWGNMRVAEMKRNEPNGEIISVEVDLDLDNMVWN